MGDFKFKNERGIKTLNVELKGKFSKEDASKFIQAYNAEIKSIVPSSYTIVINCERLDIGEKDSFELLKECFKLYKNTGFDKVVATLYKPQKFLEAQFNQYSEEVGLNNFEVIIK